MVYGYFCGNTSGVQEEILHLLHVIEGNEALKGLAA